MPDVVFTDTDVAWAAGQDVGFDGPGAVIVITGGTRVFVFDNAKRVFTLDNARRSLTFDNERRVFRI